MEHNDLIFGKNPLDRVVAIEVNDDTATVLRELPDGTIERLIAPNRFWLLSSEPYGHGWTKLKGNAHYCWAKNFDSRDGFLRARQYLRRKDVWSIYDAREAFMVRYGYTYLKGLVPSDVSVLSTDIETNGLVRDSESRIFLITNTFRKNGKVVKKLFSFDDYADDGEMLEAWCAWVREMDPSVIVGHNINGYDLPYMAHVAALRAKELRLGRDGSLIRFDTYESKFRKDQKQYIGYNKVHIWGRNVVDTLFLANKSDVSKEWESYGLKYLEETLGVGNPNRTKYDASRIRYDYQDPKKWAQIKIYAVDDADGALALYDRFIPPFFYSTQSVPKTFQAVTESASGSQINSMMVRSYLQRGHSIPKASESGEFEGALSDGSPGFHKNVFKVDVASLYPSIMLQWNITNPEKDPEANLLKILGFFREDRLRNKKLYTDTGEQRYLHLDQTEKTFINSVYGFLGATGLNFNDPEGAAAVTRHGRDILTTAISWATQKGFVVVNLDTDGISFRKPDHSPMDAEERARLLAELNSNYPELIRFADDGYYQKVLVFKAKTYVLDNGKKLKNKGSALKSSTLEKALKSFLDEAVRSILDERDDLVQIYETYIKKIFSIKTSDEMRPWTSRKTLTNTTYASKRTNEAKIRDAVAGKEYVVGDKVDLFFREDGSLCLLEDFDGSYDRMVLLKKLYNVTKRLSTVVDAAQFINYTLKRHQSYLEKIVGTSEVRREEGREDAFWVHS